MALFPVTTPGKLHWITPSYISDGNITCALQDFKQAVEQAAWYAMPTSDNSDIYMEYSPRVKEKLAEERSFASYGRLTDAQS